jgi:hypothetical protein
MERTEMRYPDPERNPRRVRAGSYEARVASGDEPWRAEGTKVERRPIHILTSRVQSHLLALELRSRAHTLVAYEEAAES